MATVPFQAFIFHLKPHWM